MQNKQILPESQELADALSAAIADFDNSKRVHVFCRYSGQILETHARTFDQELNIHASQHWIFGTTFDAKCRIYLNNPSADHEQRTLLALALILDSSTLKPWVSVKYPVMFDPTELQVNLTSLYMVCKHLTRLTPTDAQLLHKNLPRLTLNPPCSGETPEECARKHGTQLIEYVCVEVAKLIQLHTTRPDDPRWAEEMDRLQAYLGESLEAESVPGPDEPTDVTKLDTTNYKDFNIGSYWGSIAADTCEALGLAEKEIAEVYETISAVRSRNIDALTVPQVSTLAVYLRGMAKSRQLRDYSAVPDLFYKVALTHTLSVLSEVKAQALDLQTGFVPMQQPDDYSAVPAVKPGNSKLEALRAKLRSKTKKAAEAEAAGQARAVELTINL